MSCEQCEAVRTALDESTMCQASTPAQRIRDAFAHDRLVLDVIVYEYDKKEQSLRSQITYWTQMAVAVSEMRVEAG
jgi:hypothetical protein